MPGHTRESNLSDKNIQHVVWGKVESSMEVQRFRIIVTKRSTWDSMNMPDAYNSTVKSKAP